MTATATHTHLLVYPHSACPFYILKACHPSTWWYIYVVCMYVSNVCLICVDRTINAKIWIWIMKLMKLMRITESITVACCAESTDLALDLFVIAKTCYCGLWGWRSVFLIITKIERKQADMCRGQKQDPRSTGSDGKTAWQDPGFLGSHDIAWMQDPRSKGSHNKTICEIQDP